MRTVISLFVLMFVLVSLTTAATHYEKVSMDVQYTPDCPVSLGCALELNGFRSTQVLHKSYRQVKGEMVWIDLSAARRLKRNETIYVQIDDENEEVVRISASQRPLNEASRSRSREIVSSLEPMAAVNKNPRPRRLTRRKVPTEADEPKKKELPNDLPMDGRPVFSYTGSYSGAADFHVTLDDLGPMLGLGHFAPFVSRLPEFRQATENLRNRLKFQVNPIAFCELSSRSVLLSSDEDKAMFAKECEVVTSALRKQQARVLSLILAFFVSIMLGVVFIRRWGTSVTTLDLEAGIIRSPTFHPN